MKLFNKNNKKEFYDVKMIEVIALVVAVITFLVAFITLIITRYTDILKKPVITFNDIPIAFLVNNEYSGFYNLYNEKMYSDTTFSDKFVTTVNIANPLSNNIQLNKIYIDINNIKRDNSPYFKISSKTKEDGVYLQIYNCGWGNANDINFIFTCSNDAIYEYIDRNKIDIYVKSINAGDAIEYPFILNKDVKDTGNNSTVNFSVSCIMDGLNQLNAIKGSYLVYDIHDGKIEVPGIGGASDYIYGIEFDTSKNNFSFERKILEEVCSGEVFTMPICIFPDQTCTFDIDIKFQYLYNGKEKYIHCQQKDIKIEIDSHYENECIKDISNMKPNDIDKIIQEDSWLWLEYVIFSYPFVEYNKVIPRCPICYSNLHCVVNTFNILNTNKYNKIWKCDNCNIKL